MYPLYLITSMTAILLMLTQIAFVVGKLKDTIRNEKNARELLYIFHLMKEDIIKSINLNVENNTLILYGITLSTSETKNDENWGIVISCSEETRKGVIYNMLPSKYIWVWDGNINNVEFKPKRIIRSTRRSGNTYEVEIESCQGFSPGHITANHIYEVRWSSEEGKIYRYIARHEVQKKEDGKFFAGKGNISVEGKRIIIWNENHQINFSIPD